MAKPTGVTGAERYGWQTELARTLVDTGLCGRTQRDGASHACYRVGCRTCVSPSVIVNRVEYLICRCESSECLNVLLLFCLQRKFCSKPPNYLSTRNKRLTADTRGRHAPCKWP